MTDELNTDLTAIRKMLASRGTHVDFKPAILVEKLTSYNECREVRGIDIKRELVWHECGISPLHMCRPESLKAIRERLDAMHV